ncbi:uncharacterized protein LOC134264218 [Saccostrea cucullata]|uniref:uncharacterized protein LOC134264218 n=1 Tax=Saccostrea cuccullata TaxID=36930 RepID=UPI002ED5271A
MYSEIIVLKLLILFGTVAVFGNCQGERKREENHGIKDNLEDYVKALVEKEVKTQLKDILKVQEEKIRSMEIQIQRERLYRRYLEKNLIALKKKKNVQVSKDVSEVHKMGRRYSDYAFTNHVNENYEERDAETTTQREQERSSKSIRLIGGQENSAQSTVAFYAYMSKNLNNPSAGHVLVFDNVKTNVGSGYNHHDGIFTAPSQGSYVFSWTIASWYHSYVYTELVVNSAAFGKIITNSQDISDEHVGSSVVAVVLNPGDVVYIRIISAGGTLASTSNIFSSFSGWKLN